MPLASDVEHFVCKVAETSPETRQRVSQYLAAQAVRLCLPVSSEPESVTESVTLHIRRDDRHGGLAECWSAVGRIIWAETEDRHCRALLHVSHPGCQDYVLLSVSIEPTADDQVVRYAQGIYRIDGPYRHSRDTTSRRRRIITQLSRFVWR